MHRDERNATRTTSTGDSMANQDSDFGRALEKACAARGFNCITGAGQAYVYVPGAKGLRFRVASDTVRLVEGPLHDQRTVDFIVTLNKHADHDARCQWQVECVMDLVERHMGLVRGAA